MEYGEKEMVAKGVLEKGREYGSGDLFEQVVI